MEEKKNGLNQKEKRTLMIVLLAIVLALVFGISYAYFLPQDQSDVQTITTQNIGVDYLDSEGTSIVIPNGVISINYSAFLQNVLENIIIDENVETIGELAFSTNSEFTSIVIRSNVKSVGINVFEPSCLTKIIVQGKSSLSEFTDSTGLTYYEDIIVFE